MSPTVAWQLSWGVGASFCVLAGLWFLVLTVPEEGRPFAWVLALAFCVHCVAAAANLRRLLWDAFVGPGRISYLSVLLETGLWALISAGVGRGVRGLLGALGLLLLEGLVRASWGGRKASGIDGCREGARRKPENR